MLNHIALLHMAFDEVSARMGLKPEGVYFQPDAVVAAAGAFACNQADDAPDSVEGLEQLSAELRDKFTTAYHSWHARKLGL